MVVCFSDIRGFTKYCHELQRRALDTRIQHFLTTYFGIYLEALVRTIHDLRHSPISNTDRSTPAEERDVHAWLDEVAKLLLPTSYKNLGDGVMIVWELDKASHRIVEGLTTRYILEYVQEVAELFHHMFTGLSQAETDAYSELVSKLRLGFGLARGHTLRLDFPGKSLPDYSGAVVNLAARLMNYARPQGIVAQLDFSRSLLEMKSSDKEGRILTIREIKGMEREEIRVWSSEEVVFPQGIMVPSRRH